MRHDLHRLAQIVAATFLVDDTLVNTARRDVVCPCRGDVEEPFVVPEVEVGFMTVHCYIALAVFIGIQRSGVNINVGVELLDCYFVTSCLKQFTQRGRNDSFTQRGNHASRNKNVLSICHDSNILVYFYFRSYAL